MTINCMLAVLSGKGGVGKSTIAYNLVLELQKLGFRVGLFDADIDTPNVPQIANLPGDTKVLIVDDEIIPYDHHGIQVVSLGFSFPEGAPVLWDDSQKQEVIEQVIRITRWDDLDYLVIDCPAGTGGELYSVFSLDVKGGIIVTTPHAAAVSDAKRARQTLMEYKTPLIGIINNMSYSLVTCPNCGETMKKSKRKEEEWPTSLLLGELPDDTDIEIDNIIPGFDEITVNILDRLPLLKPVKHHVGKKTFLQRTALKVAIRKLSS